MAQLEKERKECERREKQEDMEADYQHCEREQDLIKSMLTVDVDRRIDINAS